MGDHRRNPRAIAASMPRPFRVEEKQPDVVYGFQLELVVEPNAGARARMQAEAQVCKDAGGVPPVFRLSDLAEDEKELVVYKTYAIQRTKTPGGLELQQPVVTPIRIGEFDRRPLSEVLAKEDVCLQRFLGTSKPLIGG